MGLSRGASRSQTSKSKTPTSERRVSKPTTSRRAAATSVGILKLDLTSFMVSRMPRCEKRRNRKSF
jgi:hypothetical protein